jgi:hypothetical protein
VTLRLSLARLSRSLLETCSIVVMRRPLPPHPPAHTLPPDCSSLLPQPHKTSCEGVPGARRPWTLPNAAHPAAGRAAPGARQGAMHWRCRGVMMADVAGGARPGAPASRTPRRRSGPRGHQIGARASACTNAARDAAAGPLPSRAQITSTDHAHSSRIQARHFHQPPVPCISLVRLSHSMTSSGFTGGPPPTHSFYSMRKGVCFFALAILSAPRTFAFLALMPSVVVRPHCIQGAVRYIQYVM